MPPISAPPLAEVTIKITPLDARKAHTMASRVLRKAVLYGRAQHPAEWDRFKADAPPFIVEGFEALFTQWQNLELSPLPPAA